MSSPTTTTTTASTGQLTFADFFIPHKHEASIRLRNSSVSLITLVLLTHLLPLPSPIRAWRVMTSADLPVRGILWSISAIELALLLVLTLNILQSMYAIKYPRAPLYHPNPTAPTPSPLARRRPGPAGALTSPRRRLEGLTTPLSTSQQPSDRSSQSGQPWSFQSSSSLYASTPAATPSRIMRYAPPPGDPLFPSPGPSPSPGRPFAMPVDAAGTSWFGGRAGSMVGTPSPAGPGWRARGAQGLGRGAGGGGASGVEIVGGVYRGLAGSGVGQALDGSFLERLAKDAASDDEDWLRDSGDD